MVGGSLRVLRLLPPLRLIAMIELKYCAESGLKNNKSNKIDMFLPKRNILFLSFSTLKKYMTQHGNMTFKKTSLIWD
jgi:hypothetical protein